MLYFIILVLYIPYLRIVDIDYSITAVFRPSYLLYKGLIYCLYCLFAETNGIFIFIIFIFLVAFSFLLKKDPFNISYDTVVKNPLVHAGDTRDVGSIPGSGRLKFLFSFFVQHE